MDWLQSEPHQDCSRLMPPEEVLHQQQSAVQTGQLLPSCRLGLGICCFCCLGICILCILGSFCFRLICFCLCCSFFLCCSFCFCCNCIKNFKPRRYPECNRRNKTARFKGCPGIKLYKASKKYRWKSISIGIFQWYSVFQELEDPYYQAIRVGIEKYCADHNIHVVRAFQSDCKLSWHTQGSFKVWFCIWVKF